MAIHIKVEPVQSAEVVVKPPMDHLQDDAVFDDEEEYEASESMGQDMPSTSQDHLERCGQWLLSIPRQDLGALQQTQEYNDFVSAFERLANVHRSDVARTRSLMTLEEGAAASMVAANPLLEVTPSEVQQRGFSFLQHMADDDIIIRTLEFLDSQSLVPISMTCSRFRELAHRSAAQRTYDVAQSRQLNNVMKLLRAKEQIEGIGTGIRDRHVRVPVLLLGRRVLVTNAGDPEYNGVYFCTGSNGNGFIFTKPRFPERRILRTQQGALRLRENIANADQRGRLESEVAHPGQLLRCIIAKRFSNESILWYISKEVLSAENAQGPRAGAVTQTFSYWSKLMVVGDASPDICRYPSQSSILTRHNEGWQTLTTTRATRPPMVELLD